MHGLGCFLHAGAEKFAQRLVPQANTQNGQTVVPGGQKRGHHTGILGIFGTRRKHNSVEIARLKSQKLGCIVAHNDAPGACLLQVIVQVIGKGIVIVEQENFHCANLPSAPLFYGFCRGRFSTGSISVFASLGGLGGGCCLGGGAAISALFGRFGGRSGLAGCTAIFAPYGCCC